MNSDKEILTLAKTPEMQEKIKEKILSVTPKDNWKQVWKDMPNYEKIDFVNEINKNNKY